MMLIGLPFWGKSTFFAGTGVGAAVAAAGFAAAGAPAGCGAAVGAGAAEEQALTIGAAAEVPAISTRPRRKFLRE